MSHWIEALEDRTLFAATPADIQAAYATVAADITRIANDQQAEVAARAVADETLKADLFALGKTRAIVELYTKAVSTGLKAQVKMATAATRYVASGKTVYRPVEVADADYAIKATAMTARLKVVADAAARAVEGVRFMTIDNDVEAAPGLDAAALSDLAAAAAARTPSSTSMLDADIAQIDAQRDALLATEATDLSTAAADAAQLIAE